MKRTLNFSRYLSLVMLISAVNITKSYSAGFATDSHSASGLATSYSGAVTGSHDISDSFFNPAIFADVDKNQLVLSATYIDFSIDDDNANSTYASNSSSVSGSRNDNAGNADIIPALFFATPINDNTTFGISVTTPFGLTTS
jgi:long-chain fatty acid transport protein